MPLSRTAPLPACPPGRLYFLARMGACAAACAAGLAAQAPAQDKAPDPGAMARATHRDTAGTELPYRRFRPPPRQGQRPFLILFLHGAGERGKDNRAQLRHGVAALLASCKREHGILLAPQCPRGSYWPKPEMRRAVLSLLRKELADSGADPRRIYLTGLSMGGMGSWALAMDEPELFAAVLPICGSGDPGRAARLSRLPIWNFHGDQDRAVRVEHSRRLIAAIKRAGGAAKYTEYPGVGHNSWTRTYQNPEVHRWLLAQRRPALPKLRKSASICFLGDSITFAGARKGGYIRLLEAGWKRDHPQHPLRFRGAGISGNKVPDLLARLDQDVLSKGPDLVFVYIGTNDVWHRRQGKGTPLGTFRAGLEALIDRIRAAKADAILCTPALIGERPRGKNPLDAALDEYAAALRGVARQKGCLLVDLREEFCSRIQPSEAAKGQLTRDGVHLNPAGNQLLAELLQARLESLLR